MNFLGVEFFHLAYFSYSSRWFHVSILSSFLNEKYYAMAWMNYANVCVLAASVLSDSLHLHGLLPARLLCS